ncbi:hemolysin family protein [Jeotgalibacillus sp. R-1-5s-1]|uniref:hemolysin family protein n=1 Tax=Jeotgalibacillus sp. R-1-5s-1 TaxID=2555897 RepID=UPI00106BC25D|nr:hemolysin family protein [Jeotgalibacillus sp. R-1-5s-1]TFD99954.1 HlyC/CorC family transporter [Jeotgalibacillus sp. R-1-5s-1]
MTVALVTLVVLILVNAFFAASELALVNLNDNKVKRAADEGDPKAKTLYNLISKPSLFLSTIQIGITLAGFLSSAFAADFFAGPLAESLVDWGVPLSIGVLNTISVVTITIILSYFTLIFGELVPKQLALQKAEAISRVAAGPLSFLAKVSAPIVAILTFSTNTVVRLFGVDPNAKNEEATEEDIRMLVDVGRERGTINPEEKTMINNIFEFNDKIASDIITHRRDMSALPIDASFEDVLALVNKERYTRFPVYEGEIDKIVGVLHAKDLFQYVGRDEPFDLKNVIRKPFFVLESQPIDVLFASMQKSNTHIAIVIDEYGGTEGLITIEDVIEEIVGEILSESLEPGFSEQEITELTPGEYEAEGTFRLWELEEIIHVSLPSEDLDTISGFMIHELGYIPSNNERPVVKYKNTVFKVLEVSENRIERVHIKVEKEKHDAASEEV